MNASSSFSETLVLLHDTDDDDDDDDDDGRPKSIPDVDDDALLGEQTTRHRAMRDYFFLKWGILACLVFI